MKLYRVQMTPARSMTVEAPDPMSAMLAALEWARDNGEDVFINSMSESVVEVEPGSPTSQGSQSSHRDQAEADMVDDDDTFDDDDSTIDTVEMQHALRAAADTGGELPDDLKARLLTWLTETWGERINGDFHSYVDLGSLVSDLASLAEDDPIGLLRLPDSELLALAREAVDRVFAEDSGDLSGATVVGLPDGSGGQVWIVNGWGGGYIASEPDQEFAGPFRSKDEAQSALDGYGWFSAEQVTLEDVGLIRDALAAKIPS